MKTDKLYTYILLFTSLTMSTALFAQSNLLAMTEVNNEVISSSNSDEVDYLNAHLEPVSADYNHIKFIAVKNELDEGNVVIVVYSAENGKKLMTGKSRDLTDDFNGYFEHYYENGQLESCGEYRHGIKIGEWQRFTKSGKQKASKFYSEKRMKMLLNIE